MSRLKKKDYEAALEPMQLELNNLARWLQTDEAAHGGPVRGARHSRQGRLRSTPSPRFSIPARSASLRSPNPAAAESTQWYFQRYVEHLPAAGELVLFDRSWYNRAGVEKVMGFCTDDEYQAVPRAGAGFETHAHRRRHPAVEYWLAVDQK